MKDMTRHRVRGGESGFLHEPVTTVLAFIIYVVLVVVGRTTYAGPAHNASTARAATGTNYSGVCFKAGAKGSA